MLRTAARPTKIAFALALLAAATPAQEPDGEPELTIPAFCGYAHPDPDAMRRDRGTGAVRRGSGELRYYVELSATGRLRVDVTFAPQASAQKLSLKLARADGTGGSSTAYARNGAARENGPQPATFTRFVTDRPGRYVLTLAGSDERPIEDVLELQLRGPAARGARASTVERRNAASVHLWYDVPKQQQDDVEWFYCELQATAAPLWTYYMATGWHRGYFGMQVNSPTERRIIFSVWDAGDEAVDRNKVDDSNRVQLVAKGEGVHAGGFGNEGTGGHSHLVHHWRMDDTVRFLVRAEPDEDAKTTTYTGWFSVLANGAETPTDWRLVASFKAPKDGKHLHGLYSFSENFAGKNGDQLRRCRYGNVWIKPRAGEWLPMTAAKFTHDGHGNEHRLDRGAEVEDSRFVLQHGDFVVLPTRRGERLELASQPGVPPTLPNRPEGQ